jgi:hypothetical protein
MAFAFALLPIVWRAVSLDRVNVAYALWGAGDMEVGYLKDHDGQWPRGWGDLKPYFDAGGGRVGGWSYSEYQRHVAIEWDVNTAAIEFAVRTNPRPTFQVITPKDWLITTIKGHDPNEILYHYFREKDRPQLKVLPTPRFGFERYQKHGDR